MKRLASQKWLLVVSALAILLPLGAVACGSSGEDEVAARRGLSVPDRLQAERDGRGIGGPGARSELMERRESVKERSELRGERREALLDELRDEMSPEDQQLLDQLRATIEEYRDSLLETRQELSDTVKQLHELTDKYLDLRDTED